MTGLIVAGTGHRPEDAEPETFVRVKVATKFRYTDKKIDAFITGMAAGFDLWAADEAHEQGIDLIAAVPWKGHTPRKDDEELYAHILSVAKEVVYVHDSEGLSQAENGYPGHWVYHKRNEYMVDRADLVLAYWNPNKEFGGTFQCYKYAKEQGKPIANIWWDPPF